MTKFECYKRDKCSAPLCPIEANKQYVWYVGEDVCSLREFDDDKFIVAQKLLNKLGIISDISYSKMSLTRMDCNKIADAIKEARRLERKNSKKHKRKKRKRPEC